MIGGVGGGGDGDCYTERYGGVEGSRQEIKKIDERQKRAGAEG